jgi:hypothetical protein
VALEGIDRFVRVYAACGASPSELIEAITRACQRNRKRFSRPTSNTRRELSDAAHLLTVWSLDPLYLDRDGAPIQLPARGPAPSLEALTRKVHRSLSVDELLPYLLRAGAVRRVGSRYIPRSEALSLRGARGPDRFRNIRALVCMLRTLEHNLQPKSEVRSWFEYIAENPRFPVRARADFDTRLDRAGMRFLHALDADMHRRERARRSGEPTGRIGVGVYRFEEDPVEEASKRPRPRRTGTQRRS